MFADQGVLYVEDEPLLRELAMIVLEDAGFESRNGGERTCGIRDS
jgi:hypothetical protein